MSFSTVRKRFRVALRIRPLSPQEQLGGETECVTQLPDVPQIVIGADRAFTFDHVFSPEVGQEQVYEESVKPLVQQFLQGYNATILAYGQTGSGKTFSMGTGLARSAAEVESPGVVPRAIGEIWENLKQRESSGLKFSIDVSFLELYNEDLIDLLNPRAAPGGRGPTIREDNRGNMVLVGVERRDVYTPDDVLELLHQGALSRTTASTDMNHTSSRSHAIFTVYLRQQDRRRQPAGPDEGMPSIVSKIHFVDLAGSERIKRTGAAGDRAREGISINAGLLALGNVISALGSSSGEKPQQTPRRTPHVPYRDSKLTRLLQDSLGGNSQTLMLACISPSNKNNSESLNTIRYANRARNIRNKVAVTFDKNSSAELSLLKTEVARLRGELSKLKLQRRQSSAALVGASGDECPESEAVERLRRRNAELMQRLGAAQQRVSALESERDMLQKRITKLGGSLPSTPGLVAAALPAEGSSSSLFAEKDVLETIDRELGEQAARHEQQITSVRRHYESKLELLQETLGVVQQERDVALQRLANAAPNSARSTASTNSKTLGLEMQNTTPTRLRKPSQSIHPPQLRRQNTSSTQVKQLQEEAERLAQQVQQQAQEIAQLRHQRTGRHASGRNSLLSFSESSCWRVARDEPDSGGPQLLRAAFVKAALETEVQRCVRARQLLRERDAYLTRQDRLMNEQNDALLRMQCEETDAGSTAQMQSASERIAIIDAELHFLDLKVRDAEAEVAQLAQSQTPEGGDGVLIAPLANLSGLAMRMVEDVVRVDYSAFSMFFSRLPQAESTGLAYLLLQDLIELRLVALRDEQDREALEKRTMDLRRTLLAMQRTALNAALSYERELGQAERRLQSQLPEISPSFSDAGSERSVYEGVRDRGILLRSALASALEESAPGSSEPLNSPSSSGSIPNMSSLDIASEELFNAADDHSDACAVAYGPSLSADHLDSRSILYSESLGVSGLQPTHPQRTDNPQATSPANAGRVERKVFDALSLQTPTNATLADSPLSNALLLLANTSTDVDNSFDNIRGDPDTFFSDPEGCESDTIPELYRSASGEFFRLPNMARSQATPKQKPAAEQRKSGYRVKLGNLPARRRGSRRRSSRRHSRRGAARNPRISLPIVPPELMDYIERRNPNAINVGDRKAVIASPELVREMHSANSRAMTAGQQIMSPESAMTQITETSTEEQSEATDPFTPRAAGKISAPNTSDEISQEFKASSETSASFSNNPPNSAPLPQQQQQHPKLRSPRSFYHPGPYMHNNEISYKSAIGGEQVEPVYCPPSDIQTRAPGGMVRAPSPKHRYLSPTERNNASLFSMMDAGQVRHVTFPQASPPAQPVKNEKPLAYKPSRIRRRAQSSYESRATEGESGTNSTTSDIKFNNGRRLSRFFNGFGFGHGANEARKSISFSRNSPLANNRDGMVSAVEFDRRRNSDASGSQIAHMRKVNSSIATVNDDGHAKQVEW
ncbi:hypothetical protein IWW42_002729 [Coemansia sp. RSA 1085]|nr:hypothetical protein IWW42_002729 [Coemansia sp. RSA 1085]